MTATTSNSGSHGLNASEIVSDIFRHFDERGHRNYGENVTERQHALQCATFALEAGEPAELVAACLLHDFGHLLHDLGEDIAERGLDAHHENLGAKKLRPLFGAAVVEPVRLHVEAKRYLCWKDRQYFNGLSEASRMSLRLQGGPMNDDEAAAYELNPHSAAATRLRHYDDRGKLPEMKTRSLEEFRGLLEGLVQA